ncbi:RagB/SusD family nutrient uptake outer membrane protein [Olivibacter ginsenosidimutans]
MKKIVKYIYLVGLSVVFSMATSCNKMYTPPTDRYTEANFWESFDNAEQMVNMAYNQMYSADKMWNDEALSDNVFEGRSNTDQRSIRNGTADPSLGLFASEWETAYGGIKTCNVFLANIDQVPNVDPSLKAQRIAEVRFVRAFLYFRLANYYGAVPFFTQDITLEEAKTISRTPKATVLEFIHSELDAIIDALPSRDGLVADDNGRITKGAAVAFQARAYLYESNWQKVVDYTGRLINDQATYGSYGLYLNYADLFTAAHEYNEEVILDYAYVPSLKMWGKLYDAAPLSAGARLNAYAPVQELVDSYLMLNGKTIDEDPDYNEDNPYVNRDPRMAATIVFHGGKWTHFDGHEATIYIKPGTGGTDTEKADVYAGASSNQTSTGYYIKKYYDITATLTFDAGLNIIMFRYADVLLMYAEAKFELGEMDASVWSQTIRAIRERAGFKTDAALEYPTSLSTEAMRETIRNERRSELALEGLRYYDIVRWKAGTQYLNGYVHGAKFANSNSSYIQLDNRRFDESRDYLWSVPRAELDKNGNLAPNNPGYAN